MKAHAVCIIAHRLSLERQAHRVYVVDKGDIVE